MLPSVISQPPIPIRLQVPQSAGVTCHLDGELFVERISRISSDGFPGLLTDAVLVGPSTGVHVRDLTCPRGKVWPWRTTPSAWVAGGFPHPAGDFVFIGLPRHAKKQPTADGVDGTGSQ